METGANDFFDTQPAALSSAGKKALDHAKARISSDIERLEETGGWCYYGSYGSWSYYLLQWICNWHSNMKEYDHTRFRCLSVNGSTMRTPLASSDASSFEAEKVQKKSRRVYCLQFSVEVPLLLVAIHEIPLSGNHKINYSKLTQDLQAFYKPVRYIIYTTFYSFFLDLGNVKPFSKCPEALRWPCAKEPRRGICATSSVSWNCSKRNVTWRILGMFGLVGLVVGFWVKTSW